MKHERISINPKVMCGKPCIAGTRIPVEHILRRLSEGMTPQEYIEDYGEGLELEDVQAAQAYAADVIGNEDIILPQDSVA